MRLTRPTVDLPRSKQAQWTTGVVVGAEVLVIVLALGGWMPWAWAIGSLAGAEVVTIAVRKWQERQARQRAQSPVRPLSAPAPLKRRANPQLND